MVGSIRALGGGHDTFIRLGGSALQALMLLVPRTKDSGDVGSILETIEEHVENLENFGKSTHPGLSLYWGALEFGLSAADPLIRLWLGHPRKIYRSVALDSLSVIGLQRTAAAIVARVNDAFEEDDLRGAAASCLGDIGGPVAVAALERLLAAPGLNEPILTGVLEGLTGLYPEVTKGLPPAIIDKIVASESSESEMKIRLVHSMGFRREGEAILRAALHDSEPMLRGAAALSLARTLGSAAVPLLRVAAREATDDIERALAFCGLIWAGETGRIKELHQVLCQLRPRSSEIWLLHPRWKREFVAALAANPDQTYAEAWSDVLRVEISVCQEKLAVWGGAYPVGFSSRREPANPAPPTAGRSCDLIFISYSHADEDLCDEFLKMLRPTAQKRGLRIWSDHQIPIGAIWRDEIEQALAHARIAVLLVSPDFLNSSFVLENELPPLLEDAKTRGARIFWIACRPCNVRDTEIGKFQCVNQPDRPLSTLAKKDRDLELLRITQELLKVSRATA